MIKRHHEDKIRSALATNSSVALMVPRQVGKTTLAINIADTIPSVYLDLENRIDLQKAQENSDKLIILDEVQRLPDIFAPIRGQLIC